MELKDLYLLIKKRLENAKNDWFCERDKHFPSIIKQQRLIGEIEAYTGILADIEHSEGVIE